ncbi:MAG: hypothetical protein ABW185_27200 [Sedimenticola sp.]
MSDFETQDRSEFTLGPSLPNFNTTLDFQMNPNPMNMENMTSTPDVRRKDMKRQRLGSETCPKCEQDIGTKISYDCSVCDLTFCFECTNISTALHEAILDNPESNFKWICMSCKHNFPSINNIQSSFVTMDKKNDKRMCSLEEKIDNINLTVSGKIQEEVKQMKGEVVQEITEKVMHNLTDEIRKEVREIDEQKMRLSNIMVFNMPESTETNSEKKKEDDVTRFVTICNKLGLEEIEIRMSFRIGTLTENKTRPLKIILASTKCRKVIIDNAKFIRQKVNGPLNRVIFAKDLTWKQREVNRARYRDRRPAQPTNQGPRRLFNRSGTVPGGDDTIIGGINVGTTEGATGGQPGTTSF